MAKALEPSSCAANWVGPQILRPAARPASTTPFTSGASGPTIMRSTALFFAKSIMAGLLRISKATFSHLCSVAVPAFPGATKTLVT
ncbi:hypothetical protein D3C75_1181190 [compost metagenome]